MLHRASPNHDDRPSDAAIDILLLHYTGMPSAAAAIERLCDRTARVSAHYCIEEDGRIWRLVPETRRAWHAGQSFWAGQRDINARSIGIELVNPGHEFGYRPYPEAQMTSLIALCSDILERHPIPPERVLGHSDVAPLRKEDPGELFDWARLAAAGIARPIPAHANVTPDETAARDGLTAIGYGYVEDDLAAVLRAFQRRWRPASITGMLDPETAGLIAALVDRQTS